MEAFVSVLLNQAWNTALLVLFALLLHLASAKFSKRGMMLVWKLVILRLFLFALPQNPLSLIPKDALIEGSTADRTLLFQSGFSVLDEKLNGAAFTNMCSAEPFLPKLYSILAVVWAIGFVLMLTYICVTDLFLRRKLRFAMKLENGIFLCEDINVPFTVGIIKPKIYLPFSLGEENRKYVIAHEKRHIKNGDNILKALAFLALSVFWFNPLLWLAYAALSKDMEYYCDECVTKGEDKEYLKSYSLALLECSVKKERTLTVYSDFGGGEVKRRILNLSRSQKHKRIGNAVCILIAALVLFFFFASPVSSNDDTVYSGTYVMQKNQYDYAKLVLDNETMEYSLHMGVAISYVKRGTYIDNGKYVLLMAGENGTNYFFEKQDGNLVLLPEMSDLAETSYIKAQHPFIKVEYQ